MRRLLLAFICGFAVALFAIKSAAPATAQTPCPTIAPATNYTPADPVPLGTVGHRTAPNGNKLDITVTEVHRGKDAIDMIKKLNGYVSENLGVGQEHILYYLKLVFVSGVTDEASSFSGNDLSIISKSQILHEDNYTPPKPSFELKGFPGASGEGWVVSIAFADDPNPVMAWGMQDNGKGGMFFALK